jgi:uncharacterized protein
VKYVIDTNVLLAAFSRKSPCHWIWQSLLAHEFILCVTTDILDEYAEQFEWFYSALTADYVMESIENLPNIEYITSFYRWQLISADPDDDKFVDCAVAANTQFIVSEDKHFKVLKRIPFPKIEVLRINDFKKILKK